MKRLPSRINRRLIWLYLLCLGFLYIIDIGLHPSFGRPQHVHAVAPSAAPKVGAAAVPFDLKTLDGKSANLEAFRGKPLVINFFASWCDPCRDEMPVINELATKAGANYSVLGIAIEDSRGAVTEFATESELVFPIALDLNSTVKRAYRIFGPPATFFIDAQGIIRDIVLGPIAPQRAHEAMKKLGVGGLR
jgi:cytochrome c biogenesis protein CcmG, thiol:disulfide interchange protein DsbE